MKTITRIVVREPGSWRHFPWSTALLIGVFQILALIPGTSRSGSTILGAILLGCSCSVAAEFSFFLSIPVMFGASLLKLLKFGLQLYRIRSSNPSCRHGNRLRSIHSGNQIPDGIHQEKITSNRSDITGSLLEFLFLHTSFSSADAVHSTYNGILRAANSGSFYITNT